MRAAAPISLALLLGACGTAGPTALLEVADDAAGQQLAATPWPSDLFLDAQGHVALSSLPLGDTPLRAALLRDLAEEQDGFGVTTGAYFPVDAELDAASIDGHARLVDLETDELVPVETYLRVRDVPVRIFVRPRPGSVLRERRRYAFLLTRGIRGPSGELGAASALAALLEEGASPGGALARAYPLYAALRAHLQRTATPASDVVAATVFTTHSVTRVLVSARAALAAAPPPAITVQRIYARVPQGGNAGDLDGLLGAPPLEQLGLDNPGGIAHGKLAYVVQGTFDAPDYMNAQSALTVVGGTPTALGAFDAPGGTPLPRGTVHVPFTLTIPDGVPLARLPVTLFQFGLDGDASSIMGAANDHAAHGRATFTIDIPFHGGRGATAMDGRHTFGPTPGPDGWAELSDPASLSFFGITGAAAAGLAPADPRHIRSAFMQAAADLMAGTRLLRAGDLAPLVAAEPRLAGLSFAEGPLAYTGVSFGAIIGGIFIAIEPDVGAAVLHVAGGGLITELLLDSALYGALFGTLLDEAIGGSASQQPDPPATDLGFQIMSYLLESGDPLAYTPYVQRAPLAGATARHVLQTSAHLDESVPNGANIALARGIGESPLGLGAGADPDLARWPDAVPGAAPLSANGPGGATSAFVQFEPATHGMFYYRHEARRFDLTSGPPFDSLNPPVDVTNPIDRLFAIAGAFLDDHYAGRTPVVADAP